MSNDGFSVQPSDADGAMVLGVRGEIDCETASELDACLSEIHDARHVILECSEVEYLDSSGLAVILLHAHRLREQDGWLRVRKPSEVVRRIIALTRTDFLEEDNTGPIV
jgi:anti-anti-sigma factor